MRLKDSAETHLRMLHQNRRDEGRVMWGCVRVLAGGETRGREKGGSFQHEIGDAGAD
jgi:hypothetical protein